MNGYSKNFPGTPIYSGNIPLPNQSMIDYASDDLPSEMSYIENILRINKGKKVKVYLTFPDSLEWRDREVIGIIEQSGRDHLIISDPSNGRWYLLLMIYVDYVVFDEKINYSKEFLPN